MFFKRVDDINMQKQEAPLTLREQSGRCRNIKGEPQIYGASLARSHARFSLAVGFDDEPWQTPAPSCMPNLKLQASSITKIEENLFYTTNSLFGLPSGGARGTVR